MKGDEPNIPSTIFWLDILLPSSLIASRVLDGARLKLESQLQNAH
jgi:hypothetical protein